MENTNRSIASFYDLESSDYASRFKDEIETKPYDQYILKRFLASVGNEDGIVLEVGCGPAQVLKYANTVNAIQSVGLDLSGEMLRQAQRLFPGGHYVHGDMFHLPFQTNSVAGIIAFYSIVHAGKEELQSVFKEFYRVLQNNSPVVICFHTGTDNVKVKKAGIEVEYIFHDYDSIHNCLQTIGFDYIESLVRKPYSGIEYPSNRGYILTQKKATSGN